MVYQQQDSKKVNGNGKFFSDNIQIVESYFIPDNSSKLNEFLEVHTLRLNNPEEIIAKFAISRFNCEVSQKPVSFTESLFKVPIPYVADTNEPSENLIYKVYRGFLFSLKDF